MSVLALVIMVLSSPHAQGHMVELTPLSTVTNGPICLTGSSEEYYLKDHLGDRRKCLYGSLDIETLDP